MFSRKRFIIRSNPRLFPGNFAAMLHEPVVNAVLCLCVLSSALKVFAVNGIKRFAVLLFYNSVLEILTVGFYTHLVDSIATTERIFLCKIELSK